MKITFLPFGLIYVSFRDKHFGFAVFQHVQQPVAGVFAVHGNVRPAGFLNGNDAHHVFLAPGHHHGHEGTRDHALKGQFRRQAI